MIALLLSILSSTLIYICFNVLGKFGVNKLHALIFNYLVAFFLGWMLSPQGTSVLSYPQQDWFWGSLILGSLFIATFYLMFKTTQKHGMSVVSVASKMSVSIPVVFVIVFYGESLNFLKVIGILLALAAVYLVALKKKKENPLFNTTLVLPFLVFFASGTVESTLKYLEDAFVAQEEVPAFSSSVFFFASLFGLLIFAIQYLKNRKAMQLKSMIGGVLLGIPNYFSIHFFIQALKSNVFETSLVFIVNNILIVIFSTFVGILFFSEKLQKQNWLGILLALISIIMVYLSSQQIT
ncbi:MAG: EamA family transporter [Psychroflexus maritimus]